MTFSNFIELLRSVGGWYFVVFTFVYAIYTVIRAFYYFDEGVKQILLGYRNRDIRLYHVLWGIIDIPAIVLGRLYHVLRYIFSFNVYIKRAK